MLPGPPVKVKALPTHIGELLLAVATGKVLTTTKVVAVDEQLFPSVTVNVYVPPIAVVAEALTVGLCVVLV